MMDSHLQVLLAALQGLSERLAMMEAYTDAALVAGSITAIRAMNTRLTTPPPPAEPPKPPTAEPPPA
jgi:hypothetical protein